MSDEASRNVLAARAQGQFPISIASSLAIESAIGILPEAPTDSPEVKKRDLLLVNIRTLIRNILGSVESVDKAKLTEYTVAEAISNEMRSIEGVISEHSDGRCSVQYYHCDYSDILREFHHSILKSPSTALQQATSNFEKAVVANLKEEFKSGPPVLEYVRNFPDMNVRCMIMTNYPVDLLQRYRFESLVLLESHTGSIKPPTMWNTKLVNGKDMDFIPFDRMTLQLFGDNMTFAPMSVKIRKKVIDIGRKAGWSPASTKDLVISSVTENRDPALEVLVKDLYRS